MRARTVINVVKFKQTAHQDFFNFLEKKQVVISEEENVVSLYPNSSCGGFMLFTPSNRTRELERERYRFSFVARAGYAFMGGEVGIGSP